MKPTMLNVNKAKSLLRAMADVSGFEVGAVVDPAGASNKHALGLSGDELRDIEAYMSTQGWLEVAVGVGGARTLTASGLATAQKLRP